MPPGKTSRAPCAALTVWDAVRAIPGVGGVRAGHLERLGVVTVDDLLRLLPRRYEDRRVVTPIAALVEGAVASFEARVAAAGPALTPRRRLRVLSSRRPPPVRPHRRTGARLPRDSRRHDRTPPDAALLVPTELLAEQYLTLGRLAGVLGVESELLTGGVSRERRARVLAGLAAGRVPLVIGTYALLEPRARFSRLALAVVDEQHRFGVRQRLGCAGRALTRICW